MRHRHPASEPGQQLCLCGESEGDTVPQGILHLHRPCCGQSRDRHTAWPAGLLEMLRWVGSLPLLQSDRPLLSGLLQIPRRTRLLDTERPMQEAAHPAGARCPSTYLAMASWGSLPAAWLHHRCLFKHLKKEHRSISTSPAAPSSPSRGAFRGSELAAPRAAGVRGQEEGTSTSPLSSQAP